MARAWGELESFDQALPQAQVQAAGDFRALPRDRIEGTVAQSNGPVLVFEGFISAHMQRIAELFAIDDSLLLRPFTEAASERVGNPLERPTHGPLWSSSSAQTNSSPSSW